MNQKFSRMRSQSNQLFDHNNSPSRSTSPDDIRNKYLNRLIEKDFQKKKTIVEAESSLYNDVCTKEYLKNIKHNKFDTSQMLSYGYIDQNYHHIYCKPKNSGRATIAKKLKKYDKKNSKVFKKLK